jgi:N-dimethylarginine dimethylaminohydrolase
VSAVLSWGSRYLMVAPDHFRVEYTINPYMNLAAQPDPVLARAQWVSLVAAIELAGGSVEVLDQRPDFPDMVYAMNFGLVINGDRPYVAMSHMRFPERRNEADTAAGWFKAHGYEAVWIGREGVGAHVESGDAFPFGGALVVGYGPRTDKLALKHLANDFDIVVTGFEITHPGMYHLDLAFCPLSETQAMVCPAAFARADAAKLLALVPEPLVLTEQEALTFCANSIVIGTTILMPACPRRVRTRLEAWGFDIVLVDVSEFHKGGGSIRCMTNPLDITIGRDLAAAWR